MVLEGIILVPFSPIDSIMSLFTYINRLILVAMIIIWQQIVLEIDSLPLLFLIPFIFLFPIFLLSPHFLICIIIFISP